MGSTLWIFLVVLFCSHYTHPEKKSEETKGSCPSSVALPQNWKAQADALWIDTHSLCAQQTPLQRSEPVGQDLCSNLSRDDEETSVVEVLTMQCGDERDFSPLLEMWNRMESMPRFLVCAARVQAGLRPANRASRTMEWSLMAVARQWIEKSTHKESEAQQSWGPSARRPISVGKGLWQGTRSSTSAAGDAYDAAVPPAHDGRTHAAAHDAASRDCSPDRQRDRERHALPSDDSTAATNAGVRTDASNSKCTGSMGLYDALSSCSFCASSSRDPGGSGQGGRSTEEVESPIEGDEEGSRHFVAQPSIDGARNEKTGREKQHAGASLSSASVGRCQKRPVGGRKRKSPITVLMETVLAAVCYQMEGIHHELSGVRLGAPGQCAISALSCQESPACLRFSVEEGAHRQERTMASFGRGGRHAGRDVCGSQRRECAEDPRRHEFHSEELGGTVILGRPPRATSEATQIIWTGGRWCLAIFWQGRRYVTDEYNRQRPWLHPVLDAYAVRLHWNHSVLNERDFLSEWQAQTHASTLAADLGYKEQLVVDVFALPLRHKSRSATVTFDDEIVVYMGLHDDITFHKVEIQHSTLSSWQGKPWTVRADKDMLDHQEPPEHDHVTFMARRPTRHLFAMSDSPMDTSLSESTSSSSSSQPQRRQTVLVLLNGQMLPASLTWNDGDELVDQITQTVGINVPELLGVHHVSMRPADLVQQDLQCLLLQVRDEHRPSHFLKLLLIDLEIYEQNEILPGAFKRFSKWLPSTLNRISAFRLLNLESVFQEHPDSSRLWHNNMLIPAEQISPMYLEDGDFIKVVIGRREGTSDCSEVEFSSFSLEGESQESDQISTFQLHAQNAAFSLVSADVDPLSMEAVCISGSHDSFAARPRTHSMNEPFSFFGGNDAPAARNQPGRPPRVESPNWLHEVWDLLCDEGATEMEEEGPIIYVNSFYISHAHH